MSVNPDSSTGAAPPASEPAFFHLEVARKERVAQNIDLFELCLPAGSTQRELPAFTPGAHLTVEVPAGMRRNYSLCSDPAERSHYQIAVKRDAAGRGGSASMADHVQAGHLLSVSAPRNNFALAADAIEFLFVAGGIGITPIMSMVRHLQSQGGPTFRLIYCTRDAASTAFIDELNGPALAGRVQIHHDQGDVAQALDLWPEFESPKNVHVYCCGPRGMMEAVADMSGHWASSRIHFESFGVDASLDAANTAFTVRLARSGETIPVEANESILDALRASGRRVPSSCESGTCGTCRTGLLAGEAEHRDMVLSSDEQADHIMVCVSRAKSAELVLDL